jgi:hypothetical protein
MGDLLIAVGASRTKPAGDLDLALRCQRPTVAENEQVPSLICRLDRGDFLRRTSVPSVESRHFGTEAIRQWLNVHGRVRCNGCSVRKLTIRHVRVQASYQCW